MKITPKTVKYSIIMMLGPAGCPTGQPFAILPPNETLGAGSFSRLGRNGHWRSIVQRPAATATLLHTCVEVMHRKGNLYNIQAKTMRRFESQDEAAAHPYLSRYLRGQDAICDLCKVIWALANRRLRTLGILRHLLGQSRPQEALELTCKPNYNTGNWSHGRTRTHIHSLSGGRLIVT